MAKSSLNSIDFDLLVHFAKLGGFSKKTKSSTLEVAKSINVSQQSVSRKLKELASEKLIDFHSTPKGIEVSLNSNGKSFLQKNYFDLKKLFELNYSKKFFSGNVSKGLGEGRYYLSFKRYVLQIEKKLGFSPFLGTLNLKGDFSELNHFLVPEKKIEIEGFETNQRSFGKIFCYPVKIGKNILGAIVFPERAKKSSNIAELIAPVNLRKKLNLKEGSKVSFCIL